MFLSSMNLIGQTIFELEARNKNVVRQTDEQTNGQKIDKQTDFHQFQKELSYDGDLSPCQV